jgi:hypothetical protein
MWIHFFISPAWPSEVQGEHIIRYGCEFCEIYRICVFCGYRKCIPPKSLTVIKGLQTKI